MCTKRKSGPHCGWAFDSSPRQKMKSAGPQCFVSHFAKISQVENGIPRCRMDAGLYRLGPQLINTYIHMYVCMYVCTYEYV